MVKDGYVTLEDLAWRWTTPEKAREVPRISKPKKVLRKRKKGQILRPDVHAPGVEQHPVDVLDGLSPVPPIRHPKSDLDDWCDWF